MSLLPTRIIVKPWGRALLPAPFVNPGSEPVGEIWFEPAAALDALLVKYIFTSENLSVQCHPSDEQTGALGLGRQGKEECWLVLDAEPGARLAIGFDEATDADTMRRAVLDGSIEAMLTWHEVAAGDFFYIPAGTVHAIGAGITLVEVQQNSNITYRLYDYGRPRELHVDEGMAVALGAPHPPHLRRRLAPRGAVALVDGPHFRLDRIDGQPTDEVSACYRGALLVIPLEGTATIDGSPVNPGACGFAADIAEVVFPDAGLCLLAQPA